jgi:hypothetical protein
MYNRKQIGEFFSIPIVTFLMPEFSVGASLQWVPVFSRCQSSVGASLQLVRVFSENNQLLTTLSTAKQTSRGLVD